jgi:hypothetical protein
MIESGVGPESWRKIYPSSEWETYRRHQFPAGDRLVMVRHKESMRAAVLSFFHKEGDLHWIVHWDGHSMGTLTCFEQMVARGVTAMDSAPAAEYAELPNFGRF